MPFFDLLLFLVLSCWQSIASCLRLWNCTKLGDGFCRNLHGTIKDHAIPTCLLCPRNTSKELLRHSKKKLLIDFFLSFYLFIERNKTYVTRRFIRSREARTYFILSDLPIVMFGRITFVHLNCRYRQIIKILLHTWI